MSRKIVHASDVVRQTAQLCRMAITVLGQDVMDALCGALKTEQSDIGRQNLQTIITNARQAQALSLPICQDTGMAQFFVDWGDRVILEGGSLRSALTQAVRQAYGEGRFRNSIVKDPFDRVNTGDNTPAGIFVEMTEGEIFRIAFLARGAGSENASSVCMLSPGEGMNAVAEHIIDRVSRLGPCACPPLIVGAGIGGSMEEAALMAKKALLRPLGSPAVSATYARFEQDILKRINGLGIGPAGLGGSTTALAVHINCAPCHMASLPVAVTLHCHALRRGVISLI